MKRNRFNLQTKIIILSTAFSLIVIMTMGIYFSYLITSTLERKIGENALSISQTIALMPEIKEAFNLDNPSEVIQPLAEEIRKTVGAEFIVVGNKEGIRYSHPYSDRIGKKMVGGDNEGVLKEGKSYVSKAIGTLGPSLRGKSPIKDKEGNIIGVVSVGFLIEDIKEREQDHIAKILAIIIFVIFIGVIGSFYLSWNIKKDIFGLEPEEISKLYMERETILKSVKEGIIAVDNKGVITVVNNTAMELMTNNKSNYNGKPLVGKPIDKVIDNTRILDVLENGEAQYNQEMLIGDEWVITNRIPMLVKGKVIGAVASFRKKTEIDQLLQELSDHKIYTDTLRAQNHEFTNKLYTISGLLQLERYKEAIQFITDETVQKDDMIEFLMENINDSKITAFFIGKITRAEEQKVKFIINQKTKLSAHLSHNTEDLVTIYGNLIENSLDAVRLETEENKKIEVTLIEADNSIIFRIEDWGHGIPVEIKDKIYMDGFTTKDNKNKRGLGLALVNLLINKYRGTIRLIEPEHQGVIFEVKLPRSYFE